MSEESFKHVEFEVPVKLSELRKEACTRDMVLAINSRSIISMETRGV
jgi:ribosome-associated translation inhibitor RaiA